MNFDSQASCDPTEKTLYTEPHSDHWGTWQDRMFQTGSEPRKGIGIDIAGRVYVLPLKTWHSLAEQSMELVQFLEVFFNDRDHGCFQGEDDPVSETYIDCNKCSYCQLWTTFSEYKQTMGIK